MSASVGGNYSTGRYGGPDRVEIGSAYLGISATLSGWRLDGTLPYLLIRNRGSAVDAGGIIVPGNAPENVSGLGDLSLRLSREVPLEAPVSVALGLDVKLPTGASQLSTGQVDVAADVEVSYGSGPVIPFASIGYRAYGDSALLELEDGWTFSVGSSFTVGATTLIPSYERSESALGGPASQEILALASGSFGGGMGWTIYGSTGLSSNAPDFAIGAGLTRSFGGRAVPPSRRVPR